MQLFRTIQCCTAVMLLSAGFTGGGEMKLMHCFAWTEVEDATSADWAAFRKASDLLPSNIKGVIRVWHGPLLSPLGQTLIVKVDDDNNTKLRAGETGTAEVRRTPRQYGMCMEMTDADALKAYEASPYHKIWEEGYSKVRVDGTTTFNILGQ